MLKKAHALAYKVYWYETPAEACKYYEQVAGFWGAGFLFHGAADLADRVPVEEYASYMSGYGFFLLNTGRAEESLKVYRSVVLLAPEITGAWLNLGNTAHELGKNDAAHFAYFMYARMMRASNMSFGIPRWVMQRLPSRAHGHY